MPTLFDDLKTFTIDACALLKCPFDAGKYPNHYGPYAVGEPSGHVMHYTASPDSGITRVRSLMTRFAINSSPTRKKANPGIHFIVFDRLHPELAPVRAKYPQLYGPNGVFKTDVLHYGLDLAFYASNWANKFTVATELRNVGKLYPKQAGSQAKFYWGSVKNVGNPKYLYKGRPPVKVRGMWCEPFTDEQIRDAETICRTLWQYWSRFTACDFLSHHHIHKNKWDCWPHFPFGRFKNAICGSTPLDLTGYLVELDRLRCPPITDTDTATSFLGTFGYLLTTPPFPASASSTAIKQATVYFQRKKGLKETGQLDKPTMAAMNQARKAYKLV